MSEQWTHIFCDLLFFIKKFLKNKKKMKKKSFRKVFLMGMLLRFVDWNKKKKFCSFSVVKFYCCKYQGNFQASKIRNTYKKD